MSPIPRRWGGRFPTSRPSSATRPAVGRSSPAMHRRSVVFPLPFGPSNTKYSPRATSSDTERSTGVEPQAADSPLSSRSGLEFDTATSVDEHSEHGQTEEQEEASRGIGDRRHVAGGGQIVERHRERGERRGREEVGRGELAEAQGEREHPGGHKTVTYPGEVGIQERDPARRSQGARGVPLGRGKPRERDLEALQGERERERRLTDDDQRPDGGFAAEERAPELGQRERENDGRDQQRHEQDQPEGARTPRASRDRVAGHDPQHDRDPRRHAREEERIAERADRADPELLSSGRRKEQRPRRAGAASPDGGDGSNEDRPEEDEHPDHDQRGLRRESERDRRSAVDPTEGRAPSARVRAQPADDQQVRPGGEEKDRDHGEREDSRGRGLESERVQEPHLCLDGVAPRSAEQQRRCEGKRRKEEREETARDGSDPGRGAPHVTVRSRRSSPEGGHRLLEVGGAPLAAGGREQHDDRHVEHEVGDDDRGQSAPEYAERGERRRQQPGRPEKIENAEDDDQARKKERDQQERPEDRTSGPLVSTNEDSRGVPEGHRGKCRKTPLHERVVDRPHVAGGREDRADARGSPRRVERTSEEKGDGDDSEQRDEHEDGQQERGVRPASVHAESGASESHVDSHPGRFDASSLGVTSAFSGEIDAGSIEALKTDGTATVSFAGYSHSDSGSWAWTVPFRNQFSNSSSRPKCDEPRTIPIP